jgi:hypothetical protein
MNSLEISGEVLHCGVSRLHTHTLTTHNYLVCSRPKVKIKKTQKFIPEWHLISFYWLYFFRQHYEKEMAVTTTYNYSCQSMSHAFRDLPLDVRLQHSAHMQCIEKFNVPDKWRQFEFRSVPADLLTLLHDHTWRVHYELRVVSIHRDYRLFSIILHFIVCYLRLQRANVRYFTEWAVEVFEIFSKGLLCIYN